MSIHGMRQNYLRWKAEGRCVWCGSRKVVTKRHCAKHREKFNEHCRASPRKRAYVAARKKRLKEQGKCVVCAKPSVTRTHCEEHRVRHNEQVRASQIRRQARGA